MPDHIRYDLLTQQALRGVMRNVLADAAKKGLPGDHHFYITFDTHADGVQISERLRQQYPQEMTVILQHQFWDLTVTDAGFSVGLSFGGIPEKLSIPFESINAFFDPSVQFGLQFEEITEGQEQQTVPANSEDKPAESKRRASPSKRASTPAVPLVSAVKPAVPANVKTADDKAATGKPDKPAGGGEVVRLDRFRKK